MSQNFNYFSNNDKQIAIIKGSAAILKGSRTVHRQTVHRYPVHRQPVHRQDSSPTRQFTDRPVHRHASSPTPSSPTAGSPTGQFTDK